MNDYQIIGELGKGSFGKVSKVMRKSDSKIFVWKQIYYGKMNDKEKQQIVAEVNILRELNCPNIVKYVDRFIDKENAKLYIVMEYCEGGDLNILIKKCKKDKEYIAEDVVWKIFTQAVSALHECHNRKEGKILHRDIKPGNLFMDGSSNIKLGDFGLSKILSVETEYAYTHVGTPYYMSPEQLEAKKYNELSDIWSLGCTLYELASLNPPFEATSSPALALKVKSGKIKRLPIRYSEDLQNAISMMLKVNPNERPNTTKLLEIPAISLRLKERCIREKWHGLKKREEDLKKREKLLQQSEVILKKNEAEVKASAAKTCSSRRYSKGVNDLTFS